MKRIGAISTIYGMLGVFSALSLTLLFSNFAFLWVAYTKPIGPSADAIYDGYEVVSEVGRSIPWVETAFFFLRNLVEMVETKSELEVGIIQLFRMLLRCR